MSLGHFFYEKSAPTQICACALDLNHTLSFFHGLLWIKQIYERESSMLKTTCDDDDDMKLNLNIIHTK